MYHLLLQTGVELHGLIGRHALLQHALSMQRLLLSIGLLKPVLGARALRAQVLRHLIARGLLLRASAMLRWQRHPSCRQSQHSHFLLSSACWLWQYPSSSRYGHTV